jgi:hypothetical protein
MMHLSIFLAKVLGLYFLISGIMMLARFRSLDKILPSFLEIPGLMILSGVMALLMGLLIIIAHPVWVWGWPLIITLLGYLSLFAGMVRILFAGDPPGFIKNLVHNRGYVMGALIFFTLLGGYLTYVGFSA